MTEAKTLTLKTPIDFGEERIEVLKFARLKARHLRKISTKPTMGEFLDLVAVSTGLSMSQVNELDSEDGLAAVEIVSGFLMSGQETGDQS